MSLTTDHKASRLDKKFLGLGETNVSRPFFQEPYKGRPKIYPDQIWTENDLVPDAAPSTLAHLEIDGVVQRIIDLSLTPVSGTTNAFYSPYLIDAIDFNFGDGSYNYEIKDNLDNPIAFGQGDWRLDTEAGLLTFYGTVPANMPPKVSLYRYVGVKSLYPVAQGADVNRDIYVDVAGSDVSGDGTSGNPFQTIGRAIKDLKQDLSNAKINIYLSAGTFDFPVIEQQLFAYLVINKVLKIWGNISVNRDDFLAQTAHPTDSARRLAVSNPGGTPMAWGENTYSGKLARLANYAPDYDYSAIGPHDTDNLCCSQFQEGFWADAIMDMNTTVHLPESVFFAGINLQGRAAITLSHCNVTTSNSNLFMTSRTACTVKMVECNIQVYDNRLILMEGNTEIFDSFISINQSTNPGVRILNTFGAAQIGSCTIFHRNPAGSLGPALRLEHSKGRIQRLYVYGFAYGLQMYPGVEIYMYYGHYPMNFRRVGACFGIIGDSVWDMGEWYGSNKVLIHEDVNYLLALQGGINNLSYIFHEGQLEGTLQQDVFVPSAGGLWEGNPTALTALRDKPPAYIDETRNNTFYVHDRLFVEHSPEDTQTAPNNDSITFTVGHQNQNRTIKLKGHLERGGAYQDCEVTVINNGGGVFDVEPMQTPYKADFQNISFSAALNGDLIELTMSADDNVNPVNYTFKIERKII